MASNHANPDAVKQAVSKRKAPAERAKYRHLPNEMVKAYAWEGLRGP